MKRKCELLMEIILQRVFTALFAIVSCCFLRFGKITIFSKGNAGAKNLLFGLRRGKRGRRLGLKICSTKNKAALVGLKRDSEKKTFILIDEGGGCDTGISDPVQEVFYYSQIQFAGAIEPKSGKPGLDLTQGFIIYNGLNDSFLESFAHFKNHPPLHTFSAAYLEKDSILDISENRLLVRSGYLTTIRKLPAKKDEQSFEINQFGSGEEMELGKSGLAFYSKSGLVKKEPQE